MMEFSNPIEAKNALLQFLLAREESVPDTVREELTALVTDVSAVRMLKNAVALVYLFIDDCGPILREWAAASALLAQDNGFTGFDNGSDLAKDLRSVVGLAPSA